VVEVRVREQHRVDARRVDRERLPVSLAKLLQALEQPAVDEQTPGGRLEQVARAGHRAGCSKEGQLHLSSGFEGGTTSTEQGALRTTLFTIRPINGVRATSPPLLPSSSRSAFS